MCYVIMQHRGERSLQSKLRRAQKRFVLAAAFHDNLLHEAINKLTPQQIATHLTETLHEVDPEASDFLPNQVTVCQGEVLVDTRGEGSFQR